MSGNSFAQHCREIAERFLLTAVVVDDELSVPADPSVHGGLTVPGPGAPVPHAPRSVDPHPDPPPRPLDLDPITWSFARQGMVCGVVSPREGQNDHEALAKAVARADIVILDWRLSRTTGANALPLLKKILMKDQPRRLRLIAFYTGEPEHEALRDKIAASLNGLDASDRTVFTNDDHRAIDFCSCRIVIYGKPGSPTRDRNRVVGDEDLADRLIGDFAGMVEGLLPSLVLTALAAVRDNVYRVLERFGPDLDPAFLAHRACLPLPPESEEHIVEQIASELHGIMDDAVQRTSPAGIEAIAHWLAGRFKNDRVVFDRNREATVLQVRKMLQDGINKEPGGVGRKNYRLLSRGFSGGTDSNCEPDRRLASAMVFRQVLEDTARQLSMGTVLRRVDAASSAGSGADQGDRLAADDILLCVTPRCDSVRLAKLSSFLFVPLSDPPKANTTQVVVPTRENEHRRMTISMNPSQWCIVDFEPDAVRQCVLARGNGPDQHWTFKDVRGGEYRWVGELKAEFAQSVAQAIAERMSRMPLNKSEWLRRSERR